MRKIISIIIISIITITIGALIFLTTAVIKTDNFNHIINEKVNEINPKIKLKLNQISNLEVLGPVDSPLLKIKKNFRSRLLIRFNNRLMMQKKITNLLNGLRISSKIKLTVDVDPVNFV